MKKLDECKYLILNEIKWKALRKEYLIQRIFTEKICKCGLIKFLESKK